MKYEEDLKPITDGGKVNTYDIVYFLQSIGILKDEHGYNLFKYYMKLAYHNGYMDSMKKAIEIREEMNNEISKKSIQK